MYSVANSVLALFLPLFPSPQLFPFLPLPPTFPLSPPLTPVFGCLHWMWDRAGVQPSPVVAGSTDTEE